MSDIELLENQLYNDPDIGQDHINEINFKKEALENIYKHEAEGAFIRSRAKYKLEGEKASKMFCSLEKYNGLQKYVPQLLVKKRDGTEELINEQLKVENEIRSYYTTLFSNQDFENPETMQEFLGQSSNSFPKISEP